MFSSKLVDFTNLKPDASKEDLDQLAAQAKANDYNSICIRSDRVEEYAPQYRCSATIDFPQETLWVNSDQDKEEVINKIGASPLETKLAEAKAALEAGASELDPVINLASVTKHDYKALRAELQAYVALMQSYKKELWLKPIFSCELLDEHSIEFSVDIFSQVVQTSDLSKIKFAYKNSTGFIKTETDYPLRTTSVELISFISNQLDEYDPDAHIHIKAAGGIKNQEQANEIFKAAGGRLSHIGTSSKL